MKKIVAILLAMLMAFTVAVFSVSAVDADVAAIGGTTYETLAQAITNAVAGDTITLLDDVTEDVTIDKDITLDGADKQYTGRITLGKVVATIKNFKFVNSQILKPKEKGSKLAEVTVENCSFEGKIANDQYSINVGFAKKLTVKDCDAKNVGFGFVYVPSEVDNVVIENVDVDGASYGVHITYGSTAVFKNVTIKNAYVGIMNQNYGAKTFTFENCVIDSANPVVVWEKATAMQNFYFKGENDFGTYDYTFGSSYVIIEQAKLGDEIYTSLQDAIDACVVGDNTIELLLPCAETATIKQQADINIVIDGKGKPYSGTIKVDGNNRLDGAETLTIKNINFETSVETYSYFINAEKNAKDRNSEPHNLTVDSCTFKGTNWQYAIATRTPNNLVVKNCSAESVYYFIYNPQGGEKITVEDCTVTKSTYGIGSQKCKETYIKNFVYTGKAMGIYGRANINGSTLTMENIDVTTNLEGFPAIALWKNDDGGTSKTFKFIFKGDIKVTSREGATWFARETATNSPYEIIADCNVDITGNTFKFVHIPGAEATCMVPQTCTICEAELAPTTDHVFGEHVADGNATCTADGTKTAECIYACGTTDTIADEGSMKPHTPGAEATCMAPQTCTGCSKELDAIKDHKLGEYVSDNNATCKDDGTKTAECIYGCGLKDTITDKGSAAGHNDVDGNGDCDGCGAEICDTCGRVHEDWMSMLFCLLTDLITLIVSFFSSVC